MAEKQPTDMREGSKQAHPTEVVGESGSVYKNIAVIDELLGEADSVVPDGPSIP